LGLEYRDNPQSAIRNPQSGDPQSAIRNPKSVDPELALDRRAFLKRAAAAAGFVTGFLIGSRSGLIHASGSEIPNPESQIRNPQSAIPNPKSLSPQSAIRNPKSEYRALFRKGKGLAG